MEEKSNESKGKNSDTPVVFICDEKYAMPTAVAITSMKINRDMTNYHVFVLGVGLSEDSIMRLSSLNNDDFCVEVREVDLSDAQKTVQISRERVTLSALLKFDLPILFPQYERLLYIDSDVIVQGDLGPLFSMDIAGKYAAVVKDTMTIEEKRGHLEKINFKPDFYFNSGVLLLNLAKMREDDLPGKLLSYRLHGKNYFMDQDALNVVFDGNVKYISPYYNCLTCFFEGETIGDLSSFYEIDFPPVKELVYQKATIIHCGDQIKPWLHEMGYLSYLYKIYYDQSPYSDIPFLPDTEYNETNILIRQEIDKLRNSKSYKVGHAITWLPRRIRKLICEK